jgi:hypothetical protein
MAETAKPKSRWCEKCKRRHDLNHEHFKEAARDRTADTVTGSKSAADLAQKAADGKPSTLQTKMAMQRLQADQERELREAVERRWGRRMRMIYGVWGKILDDPKMRLSEEEEKDFGQVHADFALAWGIAASNKLEATFDVLTMHGTCIAGRSKWVAEILQGLKKSEEKEELPAGDPRAVPKN